MAEEVKKFMIEDAELIFCNFAGEATRFSDAGKKTFAIILDPTIAERMLADGWNVKYLRPRDEDEEDTPKPYITIAVNFSKKPPKVYMVTSTGRVRLDSESIGVLDYANIQSCDLICNAYDWTVGDKSGTKAYLQTMFVTIEEDDLERKYAELGV